MTTPRHGPPLLRYGTGDDVCGRGRCGDEESFLSLPTKGTTRSCNSGIPSKQPLIFSPRNVMIGMPCVTYLWSLSVKPLLGHVPFEVRACSSVAYRCFSEQCRVSILPESAESYFGLRPRPLILQAAAEISFDGNDATQSK